MRDLPKSTSSLGTIKPFSNIELVVLDLDGTLVSGSSDLPGELITYLKNVNRMNKVTITVATGRTFFGAKAILDQLGFLDLVHIVDKTPFAVVLYNGALVLNPKECAVIWHQMIGHQATKSIFNLAKKNFCDAFFYCVDSTNMTAVETVYFSGVSTQPDFEFNGMPVQVFCDAPDFSATTVLLKASDESDLDELLCELGSIKEISVTSSGIGFIEIIPEGISKAVGMGHWFKAPNMHWSSNEVLAIGDNDNDVELLEWAGIGVSVQNASAKALEASDYRTNFGAKKAVIEVLKVLQQAQRYKKIQGIDYG